MAWILEPISIATHGYIGIGPGPTGFCPAPLAIGSHGYIRFEVGVSRAGDRDGSSSKFIEIVPKPKDTNIAKLAIIAITAIENEYD